MKQAWVSSRIAVSALFFVDGAALGSWAPHIATVKENLHLDTAVLGSSLLASAVGAVTTMPFAGHFIHRYGSRVSAPVAAYLLCAMLPLVVLAPSVPVLVGMLFFLGIFNGHLDVAMNAHSVAVETVYKRPILSGVHGWFSIGGFAGGAGAALASRLGVGALGHMIAAGAILAGTTFAVRGSLLPAEADQDAEGPSFAIPHGILLSLGLLVACAFIAEGGLWDWAAVYLRTVLKQNETIGAFGFSMFSFGMAAGRFGGDWATHRLGNRGMLIASGATSVLGIAAALASPVPEVAITGFALAGLGLANMVPIIFRAAGRVGSSAGVGLAAVTTCGYGGFLLGPPMIGFVGRACGLSFALGLLAVLCTLVAVVGPSVVRKSDE